MSGPFTKRLGKISDWLFNQSQSGKRQPNEERRHYVSRYLRRVIPAIVSIAIIGLFVYGANYYASTQTRMQSHPNVSNLSESGLKTKISFDQSSQCDATACDLEEGLSWQDAKLPLDPSKPISTLDGYQEGLKNGWMYYRLIITIPDSLQKIPEEISFTPLFIQHKKYFVYMNGRLTFSGDGIATGRIANFPIPRSDIVDGVVSVIIKASVVEADVGIAHYHSVLLGPKSALDQAYFFNQHSQYTYYLMFMLTKGAIFVVFTLFFLYSRGQPGFLNFLIYGFFVTIENLFIGDFLYGDDMLSLNQRVMLFYTAKTCAVSGLLAFFVNFYKATSLRKIVFAISGFMIATTLAATWDFGWGSKTVTYANLWSITNNYLVFTIVASLLIGGFAVRLWNNLDRSSPQRKTYLYFTGFLFVYFLLIVEEFYLKTYTGFDKRALIDLAFFLVLALITARDVGFKEGRIKTLESHMDEKRRMELELQEAAEIAKAFIPATLPDWKSVGIESYHKPLTESSGDWYAFEQSSSGDLCHFIMCDITGHGVQAAIVVSTCRSILNSTVRAKPDCLDRRDFLIEFIRDLNATLHSNGEGYHVSTVLGLTFEPKVNKLHFISAGHPAPILIYRDREDQPALQALVSRNSVLGIHPDFNGTLRTVDFYPDSQLITYTDGLPLGSNIKVLREHVKKNNLSNIDSFIDEIWTAETSRTKATPADDISVVWFKGAAS